VIFSSTLRTASTLRAASAFRATSAFLRSTVSTLSTAISLGTASTMTGIALALLKASAWTVLSTALGRAGIGFAFKAFRFPDLDGAADEAFEGP
jgi:hypothetical protein